MVADVGDDVWKNTLLLFFSVVVQLFSFEHHKSNFLYVVDKATLPVLYIIPLVTVCLNGLWMGTPHNGLRFTKAIVLLVSPRTSEQKPTHTLSPFSDSSSRAYTRLPVQRVAASVAGNTCFTKGIQNEMCRQESSFPPDNLVIMSFMNCPYYMGFSFIMFPLGQMLCALSI